MPRTPTAIEPGASIDHWPGRTITEFDDTLFSLMSMNQHPLHIDENLASSTQHGRRLVVGPLVISLVVGMSENDIPSAATLEYRDIRHVGPVFHGDTIYARTTVVSNESGIATLKSEGRNQRGEVVLTMERRIRLADR